MLQLKLKLKVTYRPPTGPDSPTRSIFAGLTREKYGNDTRVNPHGPPDSQLTHSAELIEASRHQLTCESTRMLFAYFRGLVGRWVDPHQLNFCRLTFCVSEA